MSGRLKRARVSLGLFFAIAAPGATAQTPDLDDTAKRADAAYARKDYSTAAPLYQQLADSGRAGAMTWLGWLYEYGLGLTQDYSQALAWYRKAAEKGDAAGTFHVGAMYATGRGVAKDFDQAVTWYRKAAEMGDPSGMTTLGRLCRSGQGVPQDDAQALVWFRKAAEKVDPDGMFNLGWAYKEGLGVARDDAQAVDWFRKSAEMGSDLGMNGLGMMYEAGRGAPQDSAEAIRWYRRAADAGSTSVRAILVRLARAFGNDLGVPEGTGAAASTPAGVFRIGGDVSAPAAITRVEPNYSKQALKAKLQGTVLIQIVIDEAGLPTNVKVVRSLGLGLDEKAIEAVKQWRFSPAMKDGRPVAVFATIEVNFQLRKGR